MNRVGIIAIVIVMVALLIGVVIFVGQQIFGGSSGPRTQTAAQKLLAKPTAATEVRMTVRGPITAEEHYYEVNVAINEHSRSWRVHQGHAGHVAINRNLGNSTASFRDMMAVLNNQGFMNSRTTGLSTAGVCPNGQLIRFQLYDGERQLDDLWMDSCNDEGTFAGNRSVIQTILNQLPDGRSTIDSAEAQISGDTNSGINPFAL